jgi:hypothetical protein
MLLSQMAQYAKLDTSHPHARAVTRLMSVFCCSSAVLVGVIVALVAGILTRAGGAAMNGAILRGGVAFAGTVTLFMVAVNSISVPDRPLRADHRPPWPAHADPSDGDSCQPI